MNEIMIVTR